MTASTNTQPLDTLANELWNFLGDAPDHDLPPLAKVELDRGPTDTGWRCRAHVDGPPTDSAALYEAISAYAAYWGVEVRFGPSYTGSLWPSRQQRTLTVAVSFMGVAIEVYVLVDGTFIPPGGSTYSDPAVRAAVHAAIAAGEVGRDGADA